MRAAIWIYMDDGCGQRRILGIWASINASRAITKKKIYSLNNSIENIFSQPSPSDFEVTLEPADLLVTTSSSNQEPMVSDTSIPRPKFATQDSDDDLSFIKANAKKFKSVTATNWKLSPSISPRRPRSWILGLVYDSTSVVWGRRPGVGTTISQGGGDEKETRGVTCERQRTYLDHTPLFWSTSKEASRSMLARFKII